MNEADQVLRVLAELPFQAPPAGLSAKIRVEAQARLVPVKVHAAWSIAIAASVVTYLAWALVYASQLY
jgi:hypothetical protein